MQIKPYFLGYKELSRDFVCKDDRGLQFDLVYLEGKYLKNEKVELINKYSVMSNKLEKYANGITGYSSRLCWRDKKRELRKLNINGIDIEEINSGEHAMFWPLGKIKNGFATYTDYGIATEFIIN